MAAPDVEFMTKECRAVMKFLFLNGKSAKDIYDDMSVTLGKKSPSYSTVKNWVARFKTGLSALKMKTIQEGHLWSLCLKM
jgi:transposase